MRINSNFHNFFNIHTNKNSTLEEKESLFEARKNNQALDSALYEYDKSKLFQDIALADKIARKVARGESVTKEELDKLNEIAPEKLKEAEKAKKRADEIKEQIKNAKTNDEKNQIIQGALTEVHNGLKAGNEEYSKLLMESLEEVIDDEFDDDVKKQNKQLKTYVNMKKENKVDYNI